MTALLCAVIATTAAADGASAQTVTGGTAAAYPGNTLRLEQSEPLVAGRAGKIRINGVAVTPDPSDETPTPYDVLVYAQNAAVDQRCEPTVAAQRQKSLNVNLGASETITDWVLNGELEVAPTPGGAPTPFSGESLPFVVSLGVEKLLLCGYLQRVVDDVAWFQLPVDVGYPCTVINGSVTAGRRLRVRCPGFKGDLRVRFSRSGSKAVTRTVTLNSAGNGSISTRGLRRKRSYTVTLLQDDLTTRLGVRSKLRIR